MKTETPIRVFYGSQLYGECGLYAFQTQARRELPDGAIVLVPPGMTVAIGEAGWYDRYLRPIPTEDVPKPIRALALLMS